VIFNHAEDNLTQQNKIINFSKKIKMAQVEVMRNGIIEKIKLTKEQKLMLEMSEQDIGNGKIISQSDLDKTDLERLKENSLK